MKAVEVNNLCYAYGDGTEALKNLSLSIAKHKRVALLGANGSGKTTLLHHLNGLIMPQQGSVKIMDYHVNKKELKKIRQLVGMLFDNPDDQLFSTTVAEDVAFGPRNLELEEKTVQQRVQQALEMVDIIDLINKPPYNLSLGQKKRVAIAGVLAMEPELLIFDEPFSGLDPKSANQLMYLLEKLYEEGRTIIITTHDVDMAYAWADQVIILAKGRVLADGSYELLQEKDLMLEASLNTPMLVTAFNGTGMFPRTPQEANQLFMYQYRKSKIV